MEIEKFYIDIFNGLFLNCWLMPVIILEKLNALTNYKYNITYNYKMEDTECVFNVDNIFSIKMSTNDNKYINNIEIIKKSNS